MIDLDILITGGVGVITSSISAVVTWVLARKKYNSEVDKTLISNMKESLDFYKRLSDDNKERLDEVLKRNDALEEEIKELRKQVTELMLHICMSATCSKRVLKEKKNGVETDKKVEEA